MRISRPWTVLVAVATAVSLASCATKPAPTQSEIVRDALPNARIPQVWGEAAAEGKVPAGWLKRFNDPQLEAIVGEALKNNLSLAGAQAKVDAAAGAARLAGASLKPTLSAGGAIDSKGTGGGDSFDSRGAGLTLSWELDVWGRVRSQSAAAGAAYDGAELDYEFARQSIAAQAAKSWFIATETLQQQKLAEANLAVAQERMRILQERRQSGKGTAQDESLAQADVLSRQDQFEAVKNAHQQALRSVEALLGRYPSAELEASAEFPDMPGPVPAGVPSEILERRPDVAAAERRVTAAFQNVQAAKLARLPRIGLTAGAGATSSQLTSLLGQGSSFFGIGGNFFAPILDGGAMASQIEIATAEQKGSLASYGQTALAAFTDVENALGNETTLAQRDELLTNAVAAAQEALRLRKVEADAGKADLLSVLQLQTQVNSARSGLIFLRSARRSERVSLHLALGGDFAATSTPAETTQPSGVARENR